MLAQMPPKRTLPYGILDDVLKVVVHEVAVEEDDDNVKLTSNQLVVYARDPLIKGQSQFGEADLRGGIKGTVSAKPSVDEMKKMARKLQESDTGHSFASAFAAVWRGCKLRFEINLPQIWWDRFEILSKTQQQKSTLRFITNKLASQLGGVMRTEFLDK